LDERIRLELRKNLNVDYEINVRKVICSNSRLIILILMLGRVGKCFSRIGAI
jgi:hypothetical protein